jgi:hypothetical protein
VPAHHPSSLSREQLDSLDTLGMNQQTRSYKREQRQDSAQRAPLLSMTVIPIDSEHRYLPLCRFVVMSLIDQKFPALVTYCQTNYFLVKVKGFGLKFRWYSILSKIWG